MYAIILSGGKQLKVEVGQTIYVEKIDAEVGTDYTFNDVLLIGGDNKVTTGNPTIKGASVVATVEKQGLGKKLRIFKYKPKTTYRKTQGHRQPYTSLVVKSIKQ